MTPNPQVPIAPGLPPTLGQMMPTTPPRRRAPRWLIWAIPAGALLVVGIGVALLIAPRLLDQTPVNPGPAPLVAASEKCGAGQLADGDKTLLLDMVGEETGTGDLTTERVMCVLTALEVPTHLIATMEQTTALDGRQTGSWGEFEASWTYHPDRGLDVIVRQK